MLALCNRMFLKLSYLAENLTATDTGPNTTRQR